MFAIAATLMMLSPAILLVVPLAVLGLVGMVSPTFVRKQAWIRRTGDIGLVVLGVLLTAFTVESALSRRRPLELIVDGTEPRKIRVVYGVADGQRQSWSWDRSVTVPTTNVALVKYTDNGKS